MRLPKEPLQWTFFKGSVITGHLLKYTVEDVNRAANVPVKGRATETCVFGTFWGGGVWGMFSGKVILNVHGS